MKESVQKLMKHKATFAALGFVAGFGAYWGFQELKTAAYDSLQDPLTAFIMSYDPMEEFNKVQDRLFASAPMIETVSNQATLKIEEDESAIYYDIEIPDMRAKEIEVRIENGAVVIQGKSEKSSESSNQRSYFTSSFHQSFPWPLGVPADLDSTKVKIHYEDDRVRVQFPKDQNTSGYT